MKNKGTRYMVYGLGLVVILVVVILAVGMLQKNKSEPEQTDKKVQETKGTETLKQTETNKETQTNEEAEEIVMTAMYLTYGEGQSIFVDINNGSPFTAQFPEGELYDETGSKIAKEDLSRGDVLKIYGNGIMMQSYPGQYPGVTKMTIDKKGTDTDADKYNDLIAQIYQEPDPAEPPTLSVEYRQPEAIVNAVVTRGGYQWSYEKEDGETESVTTDSEDITKWKEINDITLSEPAQASLDFSKDPDSVNAERFTKEPASSKGEKVEVVNQDGKWLIESMEAGYIYRIQGVWENGTVEFGILTRGK